MLLNSTARTALRAVVEIAQSGDSEPLRVSEIAAAMDSPVNYLSKTLHILAREGVLSSTRGPKGGFVLATPSDSLTLASVVRPFTPANTRRCLLGRAECGDADPCAAHASWTKVIVGVEQFLAETTIADLVSQPDQLPTGL